MALLTPIPHGSRLHRLRALGELATAEGDLDDLPEPLDLPPGAESPSKVLSRLRGDER